MKKVLFTATLLILSLVFTACGGDGGKRTEEYIGLLQSGSYSLSANGFFEGVHYVVSEDISNGDFQITFRNENDTVYRYLYTDDTMYVLAPDFNYYAEVVDYEPPHAVFANLTDYDYSTAVYSKSGKHTITGQALVYDTYKLKTYDGRETEMNIYLDSAGNLYGLAFPDDAIQITLNYLSADIPNESYFVIPEDMEEIDYFQIESMLGM